MSGSSLILVSVVFAVFAGDLLPDGTKLESIAGDLREVPSYAVDQVRPDLVSLYSDYKGAREQALDLPSLARALWRKLNSDAKLLYADARDDAHRLSERFSGHRETR